MICHSKACTLIIMYINGVHVHKSIRILSRGEQGCCCFFLIIKNFLNQQTGPDGVQNMHLLKSKIKVMLRVSGSVKRLDEDKSCYWVSGFTITNKWLKSG